MLKKLPSRVGQALRGVRADALELVFNDPTLCDVPHLIDVTSAAFADDGPLPRPYTADGAGVSPPVSWRGVPDDSVAVAMLIEDADSPTPRPLVHAIIWGLPGKDGGIPEGALSNSERLPMGRNSYLSASYLPPDPPPGHGLHRYVFQVFALDTKAEFESAPGRTQLLYWLQVHAIAKGMLTGTYERP